MYSSFSVNQIGKVKKFMTPFMGKEKTFSERQFDYTSYSFKQWMFLQLILAHKNL